MGNNKMISFSVSLTLFGDSNIQNKVICQGSIPFVTSAQDPKNRLQFLKCLVIYNLYEKAIFESEYLQHDPIIG